MSDTAFPASARADLAPDGNPAAGVEARFRERWQNGEPAPGPLNPALAVEMVGMVRYRGDWLGVLITPWSLDLMLLPGGGSLWGDIPPGQRRYLELYGGTLPFTAADDPLIGPYQFSPLVASMASVSDMTAAREWAGDALRTYLPHTVAPASAPEAPAGVSRRGFFRRLAGKR